MLLLNFSTALNQDFILGEDTHSYERNINWFEVCVIIMKMWTSRAWPRLLKRQRGGPETLRAEAGRAAERKKIIGRGRAKHGPDRAMKFGPCRALMCKQTNMRLSAVGFHSFSTNHRLGKWNYYRWRGKLGLWLVKYLWTWLPLTVCFNQISGFNICYYFWF